MPSGHDQACRPTTGESGGERKTLLPPIHPVPMRTSTYLRSFPCPDRPGKRLLYSTKKASLALLDEELLGAMETGGVSPEEESRLAALGMLVPDLEVERAEMASLLDRVNGRNRCLRATVVVNLDCNLACAYCYEGDRQGRLYMKEETAGAAADFLAWKLDGKEGLAVDFYGGEPLLSLELIELLAARLGEEAASRAAAFSFSLVTNGTLLAPRVLDRLLPLGLSGAKVTLDGPPEVHNRFRPFRGGRGSFGRIIDNLKAVAGRLPVQIGGNFTRENYRSFPALLDLLVREGLGPGRLSLVRFDPVAVAESSRPLPDFSRGCASVLEPWLWEAGIFLREEILRRGFSTPRLSPSPCIVEVRDDFTINWDGTIYKCPGFIGHKELAAGDVQGGLEDFAASNRLGFWKREECLACAYLPLCFGGCRYLKLAREGRIDGVECQKEYWDAVLEPILRQDLRYVLKTG